MSDLVFYFLANKKENEKQKIKSKILKSIKIFKNTRMTIIRGITWKLLSLLVQNRWAIF